MGRQSREKAERRRTETKPAAPGAPPARAARTARQVPEPPPLPLAPDPTAITPWAEIWRTDGLALLALFALSLTFRVLVLVETARTPYLEVANIDSASYHKWALEIAGGAWWPTRYFYQTPFYAYFLGVLYRLFGDGPWAPRIVQILVGSVTPPLVYGIGVRLFTRRVAWVAAVAMALFGVLVLEEVTLSKTSLLIMAALAGMAAYLRYGPVAHPGGLTVAGFFFGIAVVGVAQWMLTFLALAVYLPWLAADAPRERRMLGLATFVGTALLLITPVAAWNTLRGGGLTLTSGGSGLNFYEGNNERSTGLPSSPPGLRDIPEYEEEDARRMAEEALGRPLVPAEVDRYWTGKAMTFIRTHPGDWIALMVRKVTVLWNGYEIPDNYHFAFMRANFLPALYGSVTLGVVGPLALVGAWLPFWRRRGLVAFYAAWLTYMTTPLIYYVRGRYRMPLVPFLAVLAGVAVERLVRAAQAKRWDHVAVLGGALLVTTLFVNHTYCEPSSHANEQRLCFTGDMWYDQEWMKLGLFYQGRGDLDGTLYALNRAAECKVPRGPGQLTFWRADTERQKGEALASAGDRAGAAEHLRRAKDAFERCRALRYRPDAVAHHLGVIGERLAQLQ